MALVDADKSASSTAATAGRFAVPFGRAVNTRLFKTGSMGKTEKSLSVSTLRSPNLGSTATAPPTLTISRVTAVFRLLHITFGVKPAAKHAFIRYV
jgi:hypothetical protein